MWFKVNLSTEKKNKELNFKGEAFWKTSQQKHTIKYNDLRPGSTVALIDLGIEGQKRQHHYGKPDFPRRKFISPALDINKNTPRLLRRTLCFMSRTKSPKALLVFVQFVSRPGREKFVVCSRASAFILGFAYESMLNCSRTILPTLIKSTSRRKKK